MPRGLVGVMEGGAKRLRPGAKVRDQIVRGRSGQDPMKPQRPNMMDMEGGGVGPAAFNVGDTVRLRDQYGDILEFTLVEPGMGNQARGLLGVDSPLGMALLNKSPGDAFKLKTPGGGQSYEILPLD